MNYLKLAGFLLFISSLMLTLGFIAAEALYPNYDFSINKLSDLGARAPVSMWPMPESDVIIHQPSALIFNSVCTVIGLLIVVTSWLIVKGSGSKILAALLFLVGIGAVIVGLLTEQMGMIHYMGAMLVFILGPLAAIASSRSVKRPLNYLFIVTGLISLAFVPIVAMDVFSALSTNTVAITGAAENMIVYPFFLWMLAFGTYLVKD